MDVAGLPARMDARLSRGRAMANATFTDTFIAFTYETVKIDGLDETVWVEGEETFGKVPNRRSGGDATNLRKVTIGGVEHDVIDGGLHLPLAADPQIGAVYLCTALGPTSPPALLGRAFKVIEAPVTSTMTAWRLNVEEVEAPS